MSKQSMMYITPFTVSPDSSYGFIVYEDRDSMYAMVPKHHEWCFDEAVKAHEQAKYLTELRASDKDNVACSEIDVCLCV